MSSTGTNNKDDEDAESIDSQLQELIQGTETLTYGSDVFHDAPLPSDEETSLEATVNSIQIPSSSSSIQQSQIPETPLNTVSGSIPQKVTLLKDDAGNSYLLHPNGFVSPLSIVSARPIKPKVAKKKHRPQPFFHMPVPITKHTSADQLLKYHANVLESVHFNEIMDKETSSRYGEWDTSSNVLHSATNSSKSSGRSSTRGTNSLEKGSPKIEPRPSSSN
ncbi:uncharacterized protein RJT20DRAFT_139100 [Scheffersomyces xylosifermentans]|uniref:uncharacterized protein n=1 Tax=Scheffersomyces xylosifermentans TaxID=1304137 RepID=UPI00315D49DA